MEDPQKDFFLDLTIRFNKIPDDHPNIGKKPGWMAHSPRINLRPHTGCIRMNGENHFRWLESMYKTAPINELYRPRIEIREGEATIEMEISEKFHHSAGAVHGSVYFKMLDDAAFFAANSLEPEFFVLTVSFTTYMTRPVSSGRLQSQGRVVHRNKSQFIAESVIYNAKRMEIGRGNGIFVRSKMPLNAAVGYGTEPE